MLRLTVAINIIGFFLNDIRTEGDGGCIADGGRNG